MMFSLINFIIFVAAMGFFLRRPIAGLFDRRSAMVRESVTNAKNLKQTALERWTTATRRHQHISQEIAILQGQIADDAARERQAFLERTNDTAARIQRDGQRQVRREMELAQRTLSKRVLEAAFAFVETELEKGISPERQRTLLGTSLERLMTLEHFG